MAKKFDPPSLLAQKKLKELIANDPSIKKETRDAVILDIESKNPEKLDALNSKLNEEKGFINEAK